MPLRFPGHLVLLGLRACRSRLSARPVFFVWHFLSSLLVMILALPVPRWPNTEAVDARHLGFEMDDVSEVYRHFLPCLRRLRPRLLLIPGCSPPCLAAGKHDASTGKNQPN